MLRFLSALLALVLPLAAHAQVDLNRADARTLAEAMNGVGLIKAEAIVAYRNAHGPFRRIEDLSRVKGIGAKTIASNRDVLVVGDAPESAMPPAPPGRGSGTPPTP